MLELGSSISLWSQSPSCKWALSSSSWALRGPREPQLGLLQGTTKAQDVDAVCASRPVSVEASCQDLPNGFQCHCPGRRAANRCPGSVGTGAGPGWVELVGLGQEEFFWLMWRLG